MQFPVSARRGTLLDSMQFTAQVQYPLGECSKHLTSLSVLQCRYLWSNFKAEDFHNSLVKLPACQSLL